ncbi:MAG: DUF2461 domain-containing protein [Defluviitaleaceae bacterium]|nr:DUF2461 domain-containing protein [Defluviitaleaceae bacterium]MCL2835562.1 DUF2461 domain-containing protein [Defluviitaleaceae bacterium]
MFTHFSQKTLDFLIENKLRNDKAWFEENKNLYAEHVLAPLISLTEALTPTLLKIDAKLLCQPRVGGSVSRIWRDSRFSKDKSLFRDHMWTMFVRKKNVNLPEFFFVISPENFLYGCGYYAADTASMISFRKLILSGDDDFKKALRAYETQTAFQIEGDLYKKSRHPEAPENLKNWLDRKSISFTRYSDDFNLLYSNNLAGTVAEGFQTLAPIYGFLIKCEERREL